jgi:hypothetical protein
VTTPASRSLQARIAAHESWARTADRAARTAPARAGLDARFQREARERLGPDPLSARSPTPRSRPGERTSPGWPPQG